MLYRERFGSGTKNQVSSKSEIAKWTRVVKESGAKVD